jgi:Rrf2 family nitric oxide-sensitive transcriptional repressor
MRLTSYSNYCLRILMIAAARSPELTTISDVALSFNISKPHLVKCVHQLGAWNYLETVRGHNGGFRLARKAEEIRLGEVIRLTEDGFDLVECFDPKTNTCPLMGCCKLENALQKAKSAFLGVLDALTLADISANGRELLRLVDLPLPHRTGLAVQVRKRQRSQSVMKPKKPRPSAQERNGPDGPA